MADFLYLCHKGGGFYFVFGNHFIFGENYGKIVSV